MGSFLRDHWQPQTILWCDASVAQHRRRAGTAVVRFADGVVLYSRLSVGEDLSPVALEREAIAEAIRIARRLHRAGEGPVEIRTDCQMALRGRHLRRADHANIRLVWQRRQHNIAHDAAQAAMVDGAPSDALTRLLGGGVEQLRSSSAS